MKPWKVSLLTMSGHTCRQHACCEDSVALLTLCMSAVMQLALWLLQLDTCELARHSQSEVQHHLLDKVRQCRSDPNQAASFFLHSFEPMPHLCIMAVHQAWCATIVSKMYGDMGINDWACSSCRGQKQRQCRSQGVVQSCVDVLVSKPYI